MTRLLLWIVLLAVLLLVGGLLAQMMIRDAGVMMLTWNGWVVETTFWTGIAMVLTLFICVVIASSLWRKYGPSRLLSRYRNRRDQRIAKKETLIAIDSWLKGGDERALKALGRVADAGGSDRLPSAVSLAIGFHRGDWPDRYAAFIASDPELKMFANTLMAERLWQTHKMDDFIELMKHHFELRQIPWLRDRYWRAMIEAGHSVDLIPQVNETANILPEVRQKWMVDAAHNALLSSLGKEGEGQKILKSLTRAQKNLPKIMVAEIRYWVSVGQSDFAYKRLKLLLNHADQIECCVLLLDIQLDNLQKLNYLETKQVAQPGPAYCRTLGVLYLNQQLWGNAQSWLEKGWQMGDKPSGVMLAQLFEQRNMKDQASKLYRELATGLVPLYVNPVISE